VPDQIPFTRGVPSADLLPIDDLRAAAVAAFERDPAAVLSYAPAGYPSLRRWIADRHGTVPERVVVVNGSLEGLDFLARHLFGDGQGTAIVEEPTYDRTIKVLRAHGAHIEPLPLQEDGPDLGRLEQLLAATPRPRVVYLIPTFQNPSGLCTSLEKRRGIVALARERGVLVIEDDPYSMLRFEGEPLPTLHELDGGSNVIHSSSFTKTVAPGVRAGYLLLPDPLVAPLQRLSNDITIAPNTLAAAVVAAYCEAGRFEPNVAWVTEQLRDRRDAMEEALRESFPAGSRWTTPQGGYFFWVELPGIDTGAALPAATERGVAYIKGADFCASGGGRSALRLAFSACGPDAIREGIARLGAVLDAERAPAGAIADS
jgi:2-aminoadipate transaminase